MLGRLGIPGTIGVGGVGNSVGGFGASGGGDEFWNSIGVDGAFGAGGATGWMGRTRGGSAVVPVAGGNNPGVGRTVGGNAWLDAGIEGVVVEVEALAPVAVVAFALPDGVVFLWAKIRAKNPGFFGGSCGVSGIVATPALVDCLVSVLTGGILTCVFSVIGTIGVVATDGN